MSKTQDPEGGHHTRLDYHERLLSDVHRMDAFHRALSALIQPGMTVLDAGTGTGVLAMMATKLGAAHVYAVESAAVASVAQTLIHHNQLQDRITLLRGDLRTLAPVEPVDLVISECLGRFVVDDLMIEASQAALKWLKVGGLVCPERVELFLAPVSAGHFSLTDAFQRPLLGLDLSPLKKAIQAEPWGGSFGPESLLAPPLPVGTWRLGEPFQLDVNTSIQLSPGRLVGIAGWFKAYLTPQVTLETSPGIETHWQQMFWAIEPVEIHQPMSARLELRFLGIHDELPRWHHHLSLESPPPPLLALPSPQDAFDAGVNAWQHGELAFASQCFELASTFEPSSPELWENLGIVRHATGAFTAAILPLLRALNGNWASREQSLRLLVSSCFRGGRPRDGQRFLELYMTHFGPHPEGWCPSAG